MRCIPAILLLCFAFLPSDATAAVVWTGSGSNSYWHNTTNWAGGVLPGATDDVFVTNGTGGPVLTGSVAVLTLTISNKTLTFQGTNTILTASNLVVAGTSGKITHSANTDTNGVDGWQMDNLAWIVCTNCTVATGAAINVDYAGYPGGSSALSNGCGPGQGHGASGNYGAGAGYGGQGGDSASGRLGGDTYGPSNAMVECGSGGARPWGGGTGGAGGGYIRVSASGTITVNGTLTANGQTGSNDGAGGGSGGGIYLTCDTFTGAGVLTAKGGNGSNANGGAGGGGRIAVVFSHAADCTIQYQASGGSGYEAGRPGTLWLSQYQGVLPELWTGGLELMTTNWSPGAWTLTNVNTLAVFWPGFQLNVTNAIQVSGSGAGIDLGSNGVLTCAGLALATASSLTLEPAASVGVTNGNLSVSGSSWVRMYQDASMDLGGSNANFIGSSTLYLYPGAGFTNIQDFVLGTSTVYSYCNNISGIPPDAFVVRDFVVSTSSVVNADYAGYAGGSGVNSNGYGPGHGHGRSGSYGSGAGYGGRGGDSASAGLVGGDVYGATNAPADCGSGGGRPYGGGTGGAGGGYIQVTASRTIAVNGVVSARGQTGTGDGYGGGSGGGIDLSCETIEGIGVIRASGGDGMTGKGGGGGGGRIAVHYVFDNFYGTYSVTNGSGYQAGGTGSLYRALQEGYLELFISGSPQQHGNSTPYAYGSSGVASNSTVTNSVNSPADQANGVRYGCIGWTGTGSVTPSGADTQVVFTITNNSTLTWLWTNQYYLTTTSGPNGSLAADMSGWYTNGTTVVVQANADGGYHFTTWSGDVPFADRTNNPVTLTLDQVRLVQANFAGDAGGDKVWVGGSSNWYSSEHWSPAGAPGEFDAASITSAVTVTLSDCATVRSLLITNATLTFRGTNTILTASNLVVAGTSGKITHGANTDTNSADGWLMDNLAWIVCTNCTVATGAAINVDYIGYRGAPAAGAGCGPGGGAGGSYGVGGGYGGLGGRGSDTTGGGGAYGSSNAPMECGSGGGGTTRSPSGGTAGGYVRVSASGTITVNGTVTANGQAGAGDAVGGGSGGGIYLVCDTLSGSGLICARGGNGVTGKSGGGGGGRIAAVFNQATNCTIRYEASGGSGYVAGRPGTLWLSQYQGVLPELWTGGLELMTTNWSPGAWALTNVNTLAVLWPGFQLNVTGAVQVSGSGAGIDLGSNGILTCASLSLLSTSSLTLEPAAFALVTNGNLAVSGGSWVRMYQDSSLDLGGRDANFTGSSTLYLYPGAGFTNIQDFILGTSTVYCYCNNISGVPSDQFVVRDFVVSASSVVSADSGGYAGGEGVNSNGYGPGHGHGRAGAYGAGAGYGGQGGNSQNGLVGGDTYGSSNAPADCGSGGGRPHSASAGGAGGGYIQVTASRMITINGTVSANGQTGAGDGSGGGSGGGIYLASETIEGIGLIRADGGNASNGNGGGGGGGRIATRYAFDHFYGTYSVTNATVGYQKGNPGTVYHSLPEGYLELLISGSPDQHGISSPYAYGSSGVASNKVVTNSVTSPADETNGVRYGCVGWTGTGSVTPSGAGTQVVFTITANSTLAWLWTNQYYLTTTSGPNGSLAADMSGWYTDGTQVTVTANASGGYHFTTWSGDVPAADRTNNPLTVTMDQVRSMQANFAGDAGGDKVWVGASSNWYSAEHWSPPGVPGEFDAASITSAVTVTLSDCAAVRSLVLSNATLLFQGTNTILTASNLVVAGTSGKITHPANTDTNSVDGWQMSNLVWIVCTNCTVATGAAVNVDYLGYPGAPGAGAGCGPGGGAGGSYGQGGGYGGQGGAGSDRSGAGGTYGSSNAPMECGSGGGGTTRNPSGGAGGGYVRVAACGTITIDGTVTANGQAGGGASDAVGGGSGGGVYLSCDTFTGAGLLSARGANGAGLPNKAGGGGGGRIAVVFSQATNCTVRYEASGGSGYQAGRPGTLWLSQYQGVLPESWTGGLELMTNAWSPGTWDLTGDNTLAVLWPGFHLDVTGAVQASGSGAGIELGSNGVLNCVNISLLWGSSLTLEPAASAFVTNGNLVVNLSSSALLYQDASIDLGGRDATVVGGSTLTLYPGAGFTNIQDFVLGTSTVYCYCNNTSGVPSDAFVVRDFVVSASSVVNADSGGYAGGTTGHLDGYGSGHGHGVGGNYASGAGYGGRGGNSQDGLLGGDTYGSSNAPADPGSGGGGGMSGVGGGSGGGYIKVLAGRTITVNGTLTANGQAGAGDGGGGGSGGGITLRCETIDGIGLMRANGGDGMDPTIKGGGGGGGRIAVRCLFNRYTGTCSVTNGAGYSPAQVGTVYWRIQAPGTLFSVW